MKKTGVCAIGDLGMAVKYDPTTGVVDIPQTSKVGTKRYLAPEILNDTIDMENFECFKQNDVYALGLVLWEICQRSIPTGRQKPLDLEFRLPYRYVLFLMTHFFQPFSFFPLVKSKNGPDLDLILETAKM